MRFQSRSFGRLLGRAEKLSVTFHWLRENIQWVWFFPQQNRKTMWVVIRSSGELLDRQNVYWTVSNNASTSQWISRCRWREKTTFQNNLSACWLTLLEYEINSNDSARNFTPLHSISLSSLFFAHGIDPINQRWFFSFFHSQHGSLFNSIFSMITSVSLLSLWNQIIEWLVTSSSAPRRSDVMNLHKNVWFWFETFCSTFQYFNHHFFVRWVLLHWKYH